MAEEEDEEEGLARSAAEPDVSESSAVRIATKKINQSGSCLAM